MFLNKLLKNLNKRNFNNSFVVSVLQIRRTSSGFEPNVIKSKAENINIPDTFLEEYLWKGLDKWHDKVALVSSLYLPLHMNLCLLSFQFIGVC